MTTTSNDQDGEQNQREDGDPGRMWPALINLINSNARYWRAQAHKADGPETYDVGLWTMIAAIGACAGVLVAAGAAYVFFLQLCAMSGQLTEMKQTRIEAGNAARLDQRAWVGVQDAVSVPHSFTETSALNVIMIFSNSGKTPAQSAKIAILSITSPNPVFGPSADQIRALEFQPTQAIAPQGKYNFAINTGANWEPTMRAGKGDTESLIAKYPLIKNRQLILYYYGVLQYRDNNGGTHSTQFCIYMANPQTQEIGFCRDFNDLD